MLNILELSRFVNEWPGKAGASAHAVYPEFDAVYFEFNTLRSSLSICIFYDSDALVQSLLQYLRGMLPDDAMGEYYSVTQFNTHQALLDFIGQRAHHIDCLILQETPDLAGLFSQLQQQKIFFPTVIVQADQGSPPFISDSSNNWSDNWSDAGGDNDAEALLPANSYHPAVRVLPLEQLSQIHSAINQAIREFLQLSLAQQPAAWQRSDEVVEFLDPQSLSLKAQQVRLAEKLKERLGYLGVYYKRNPQNFLRHMTQPEREELLRQLREEYREIILTYFSDETDLNRKIDNFVNVVFFADVPVAQVVEIHMDLMDEFSKQLKLEGRSNEILQDYRLTLIDTIAHLCEMYRRSIPRES